MSERAAKFALLSHILPPAWSGQAIVLYRLLEGVAAVDYTLISVGQLSGNATRTLPAPCCPLARPPRGWDLLAALSVPLAKRAAHWLIERRARQIETILRQEEIQVLVACSGDLFDLPAGARAAERAGVAFIPYFFDDYLYQWTGWRRQLSQTLEPAIFAAAAAAIVPNEFLAADYQRRYGASCEILRNPILLAESGGTKTPERGPGGKARIVYTGSIYHAHYDAFCRLLQGLAISPGTAELYLYTAQSREELASHGIGGPQVHIRGHISQEEALQVQQEADLLFLPLAFSSTIPEVLRSSAPGKMGEYLASGTPILVHAPADSFLSWYFQKNCCGLVVESEEPQALKAALDRLLTDAALRQALAQRARACAENDFDLELIREKFFALLHQAVQGHREASR